jgi:hypothetical protein
MVDVAVGKWTSKWNGHLYKVLGHQYTKKVNQATDIMPARLSCNGTSGKSPNPTFFGLMEAPGFKLVMLARTVWWSKGYYGPHMIYVIQMYLWK